MKIKSSPAERIFNIFNIAFMIALAMVTLLPFINLLAVSLSGRGPVLRGEVTLIPKGFTLDVYKTILQNGSMLNAYKNTLIVVIFGTLLSLALTGAAGYVLSKEYLPGVKFFTGLIVFTMWFGGGMIPTFILVLKIGLYNTLPALFVPMAVSPFYVVIMRTFFKAIPREIEDAALIDGCNEANTLFRIVLPLSKAVFATVALWVAVARWNDFFSPLIYLRDFNKRTLQVVLREIVLANSASAYGMSAEAKENLNIITQSLQYGSIIFATLPIICIYPFLQKYFVHGVMIGSVKG